MCNDKDYISKEDFKKYFNSKSIITRSEYYNYLIKKESEESKAG